MDILAQCGTTAGRGKDGVEGGKREVSVTSFVSVMAVKEAVVKGVAEGKGPSVPRDIGMTAGAVSVVTGGGSEAVRVSCGEGVVEEKLHTRAEKAT